MTEAGVAWQQYDLSDSDADDADVKRSQVGKSKSVEFVGLITPPLNKKHVFLKHQKLKELNWILKISENDGPEN